MADPLSVTAAIVGLVVAAGHITSILSRFVSSVKDAPSLAGYVMTEVHSINSIICSLQPFLRGQKHAPKPQEAMLLVEDLIITLTGCVSTFSELELVIRGLVSDDEMNVIDWVRWVRKEGTIKQHFERLQTHKTSLTLMLAILESKSTAQAGESLERLCELVTQVMESQKDMAERMRRMETIFPRSNFGQNPDTWSISARSETPSRASVRTIAGRFAFENILYVSRVYRRTQWKKLNHSVTSLTTRSTKWSMLSGISLSEISNISVLHLPIYSYEISNYQHYSIEIDFASSSNSRLPARGEEERLKRERELELELERELESEQEMESEQELEGGQAKRQRKLDRELERQRVRECAEKEAKEQRREQRRERARELELEQELELELERRRKLDRELEGRRARERAKEEAREKGGEQEQEPEGEQAERQRMRWRAKNEARRQVIMWKWELEMGELELERERELELEREKELRWEWEGRGRIDGTRTEAGTKEGGGVEIEARADVKEEGECVQWNKCGFWGYWSYCKC